MGADIDPCTLAWAAGLFEGEGSITTSRDKSGGRAYLNLSVWSSDYDVLVRFRDAVKVPHRVRTVARTPRDRDHRQMYAIAISGAEALRVGYLLRPWLGERRLARLDEVLSLMAQNPPLKYRALGDENALEVRSLYATGNVTYQDLAKRFNVGITTIHHAVIGRRYQHLPLAGSARPGLVSAR